MSQAIRTVLLGPTANFGDRVKATASAGSVTLEYDHTKRRDIEWNHRAAAEALVQKLGWNEKNHGTLVSGCLPDGSYCHVLTGRDGQGDMP